MDQTQPADEKLLAYEFSEVIFQTDRRPSEARKTLLRETA
jgi:hypothetical protein